MPAVMSVDPALQVLGSADGFHMRFRGGWVGRPFDNTYRLLNVMSDDPLALEVSEGRILSFTGKVSFVLLEDGSLRVYSPQPYSLVDETRKILCEELAGFVDFLPLGTDKTGTFSHPKHAGKVGNQVTSEPVELVTFMKGIDATVATVDYDYPWIVLYGPNRCWSLTIKGDWLVQFDDGLLVSRESCRVDVAAIRTLIGLKLRNVEEYGKVTRFSFDSGLLDVDRTPNHPGWEYRMY